MVAGLSAATSQLPADTTDLSAAATSQLPADTTDLSAAAIPAGSRPTGFYYAVQVLSKICDSMSIGLMIFRTMVVLTTMVRLLCQFA